MFVTNIFGVALELFKPLCVGNKSKSAYSVFKFNNKPCFFIYECDKVLIHNDNELQKYTDVHNMKVFVEAGLFYSKTTHKLEAAAKSIFFLFACKRVAVYFLC